ncbi:MAG: outer membrane protein [Sphingomonadales bacterium]|jgi:Skp family chaperone for outer membrane proteins|nr:outer membrane protein [Sphingomonadales bacterium]MEA3049076.1 outer membrane protein [Sphingomonadales bacterium]
MNKLLFGAAIAAAAFAVPASAQRAPQATIIVVDTGRVFSECTACRAASAQLQTMVQQGNARAQQLGQGIQTEGQSIQQAAQAAAAQPAGPARTATENSLRQRAQALDARQTQANQEIQRLEQNLQSTRANVSRQLNDRLNPIYTTVMNAHGANLLLDTDATLAHAPALDVTNEVLAALNTALPSVSVTPLPQQAAPNPAQPQGR